MAEKLCQLKKKGGSGSSVDGTGMMFTYNTSGFESLRRSGNVMFAILNNQYKSVKSSGTGTGTPIKVFDDTGALLVSDYIRGGTFDLSNYNAYYFTIDTSNTSLSSYTYSLHK